MHPRRMQFLQNEKLLNKETLGVYDVAISIDTLYPIDLQAEKALHAAILNMKEQHTKRTERLWVFSSQQDAQDLFTETFWLIYLFFYQRDAKDVEQSKKEGQGHEELGRTTPLEERLKEIAHESPVSPSEYNSQIAQKRATEIPLNRSQRENPSNRPDIRNIRNRPDIANKSNIGNKSNIPNTSNISRSPRRPGISSSVQSEGIDTPEEGELDTQRTEQLMNDIEELEEAINATRNVDERSPTYIRGAENGSHVNELISYIKSASPDIPKHEIEELGESNISISNLSKRDLSPDQAFKQFLGKESQLMYLSPSHTAQKKIYNNLQPVRNSRGNITNSISSTNNIQNSNTNISTNIPNSNIPPNTTTTTTTTTNIPQNISINTNIPNTQQRNKNKTENKYSINGINGRKKDKRESKGKDIEKQKFSEEKLFQKVLDRCEVTIGGDKDKRRKSLEGSLITESSLELDLDRKTRGSIHPVRMVYDALGAEKREYIPALHLDQSINQGDKDSKSLPTTDRKSLEHIFHLQNEAARYIQEYYRRKKREVAAKEEWAREKQKNAEMLENTPSEGSLDINSVQDEEESSIIIKKSFDQLMVTDEDFLRYMIAMAHSYEEYRNLKLNLDWNKYYTILNKQPKNIQH